MFGYREVGVFYFWLYIMIIRGVFKKVLLFGFCFRLVKFRVSWGWGWGFSINSFKSFLVEFNV